MPFAEVQALYERGWRDMSKRYYPNAPWPAAAEIADAVKGDRTFLVLYKLLYFRHLLSKGAAGGDRATLLRHHVNAWAAYVDFFELVLDGLAAQRRFQVRAQFIERFSPWRG